MLARLCTQSNGCESIYLFITTPRTSSTNKAARQTRQVSSSPYGRTHVWKHRLPKLPNPVVPTFPQRVILSDGSTFTHYTTSPRSSIRLTRDLTNHPLWNYGMSKGGMFEDEEGSSGRMGRFRRKFEAFAGDLDWVTEEGETPSEVGEEVTTANMGKSK